MRFRRLCEVVVRHEYEGGGGCPDLGIEPSGWRPEGRRAIERHRLCVRPRVDGIDLLVEVDGGGRPRIGLGGGVSLSLDLRVAGDFIHYTDVDVWGADPPTYRASSADGGALEPGVRGARPPPGVAAVIELSGVVDAWVDAPPRFTLELAARRARWAYYLVTDRPAVASPQIEDRRPDGALAFATAELGDVMSEIDDPIGRHVRERNQGRRCFRVTSAGAVVCRRAPVRRLALLLGGELLVPELANPSIHSRSRLKVEAHDEPTPTLFRVLEY